MIFGKVNNNIPKELSSFSSIRSNIKTMNPPGISLKKQWNFFKKLRKYVPNELKDVLFPKPNEPEPKT